MRRVLAAIVAWLEKERDTAMSAQISEALAVAISACQTPGWAW